MTRLAKACACLAAALVAPLAGGCRDAMRDQPSLERDEASPLFSDGRADRPRPAGTVHRDQVPADRLADLGLEDGAPAKRFPRPVTRDALERGQRGYDAFCLPCHGPFGQGDGEVVRRGYPRPPALEGALAPGAVFRAIRFGSGRMLDLAERVGADEAWDIAAYVEVLRRARRGTLEDVPESERERWLAREDDG